MRNRKFDIFQNNQKDKRNSTLLSQVTVTVSPPIMAFHCDVVGGEEVSFVGSVNRISLPLPYISLTAQWFPV